MLIMNGIYLLLARRIENLKPLVLFQLVIDIVHYTLTVYKTGGGTSPFTFLYLMVIFSSAMIVTGKTAYLIAGITSLSFSGLQQNKQKQLKKANEVMTKKNETMLLLYRTSKSLNSYQQRTGRENRNESICHGAPGAERQKRGCYRNRQEFREWIHYRKRKSRPVTGRLRGRK